MTQSIRLVKHRVSPFFLATDREIRYNNLKSVRVVIQLEFPD